jgi:hypothetical protein
MYSIDLIGQSIHLIQSVDQFLIGRLVPLFFKKTQI